MRLILILALLCVAAPARSAFVARDPIYAGGIALDYNALPSDRGGVSFWPEVERQSRACVARSKTVIPCALIWSQAMSERAQLRGLTPPDYAEFRKAGTREILPAHLYADILPALAKHIAGRYPNAGTAYDSSVPIEIVLRWTTLWCDTPARCDALATALESALPHLTPAASPYNIDHFDVARMALAIRTWRGDSAVLVPASLAYLRTAGASRCDLCLEHVAADFARRGRASDAARLTRYRADIKLQLSDAASTLERRVHEENLYEAERLLLPAGHVALFERQLAMTFQDWGMLGDGQPMVDRFRALCATADRVLPVPSGYQHKFDESRQRCQRYLAASIYNLSFPRRDASLREEAYRVALAAYGLADGELREDNWPAPFGDTLAGYALIDGLARRDFALADRLLDRQYLTAYQFHASIRYRNGRRDAKTRSLLLQEVNCTIKRRECFGSEGYLERGESRDQPFRPYMLSGEPLDDYDVKSRDFSFRRWVHVNWDIAQAARPN